MWIPNWFSSLTGDNGRKACRSKQRSRRRELMPSLEALEDRTLLASMSPQAILDFAGPTGQKDGRLVRLGEDLVKAFYEYEKALTAGLATTFVPESAGWGGVKQWNSRNDVPLPERELRSVFESSARREYHKRHRVGRNATGPQGHTQGDINGTTLEPAGPGSDSQDAIRPSDSPVTHDES